MKKILGLLLLLGCMNVWAATPNPTNMLDQVSQNMITDLKKNKVTLEKNPEVVYRLVKKNVLPYVDVIYMSKAVLGRTGWNGATIAERKAFSQAFTQVVVNSYSSALSAYTDEKVKLLPIRGGYVGKTRLTVKSQVIRADGPPIALHYRLALMNGRWLIRDLNVEGVSVIQSFRAQFQDKLSKGQSVADITRELNKK